MPLREQKEKDVRKKILGKVEPKIIKSRSKHQKGRIYLDEKQVAIVKIPNNHSKVMKEKKLQYIASSLNLNDDQFNNLIECPLTGPGYYDILRSALHRG